MMGLVQGINRLSVCHLWESRSFYCSCQTKPALSFAQTRNSQFHQNLLPPTYCIANGVVNTLWSWDHPLLHLHYMLLGSGDETEIAFFMLSQNSSFYMVKDVSHIKQSTLQFYIAKSVPLYFVSRVHSAVCCECPDPEMWEY